MESAAGTQSAGTADARERSALIDLFYRLYGHDRVMRVFVGFPLPPLPGSLTDPQMALALGAQGTPYWGNPLSAPLNQQQ